jgi:hypothetical protein
MKKILLLVAILTACGPSSNNHVTVPTPSDRPVNPRPIPSPTPTIQPNPGQRIQLQPHDPLWASGSYFITGGEPGNYGILPGEEPIAESIYRFWEAARREWDDNLNHGEIPTDYLTGIRSGFDSIVWKDATGGKIKGFEKLKATIQEMQERCPQLADKSLQAPLEIVWATENETTAPGQFFGNNPRLRWERDRIAFAANLNSRPQLNVRAEWFKDMGNGYSYGWKWPNQTFKEQTGGKSWADGGIATKSLDETFAHEYGHYLIQAWAFNHGRNTLQTQWFAEGFAELFRAVCWGDMRDNTEWVAGEMMRKVNGSSLEAWLDSYEKWNHRFTASAEYTLGSLGDVITYKTSRGEYVPSEFFGAILTTLGQMEGRIVDDYPVKSTFDGTMLTTVAPWSGMDLMPSILRDAPRLWTRQELLSKFCENYDCGPIRPLVAAEASGLVRDEW